MINLLHGDCLEQMKTLEDNSVDSIVSDPPYGISFMAKKWDYDVPSVEVWEEAMRVLKPGGHALIACGTRTQHRMVVNIEDAGFEIRDVVSWIYGSGFPKSLNISKAIDKAAGAVGPIIGKNPAFRENQLKHDAQWETAMRPEHKHGPATESAKQWDGWGTALKPACEFFTLCRKPLSEKTIAANVLKWGTGGINIDGCRVGTETIKTCGGDKFPAVYGKYKTAEESTHQGRFPANLIHDGSQEVLELFPETKSGGSKNSLHSGNGNNTASEWTIGGETTTGFHDKGSAARFFYCAKASKKDRDEGLEGFDEKFKKGNGSHNGKEDTDELSARWQRMAKNTHPTVKPTALMAYLCRLITPTGGIVLDPYMGSGSTGKAAVQEGFSFVGCELDKDYFDIATARVTNGQDLELLRK